MKVFRGVFTIDALAAMMPILVIVYIGFSAMLARADAAETAYGEGRVLGLLGASEAMIRENAVCEGGTCHYGWINGTAMNDSEYTVGAERPKNADCIYRIVAYGDNRSITKLYICHR
jgi:hypothetical protein